MVWDPEKGGLSGAFVKHACCLQSRLSVQMAAAACDGKRHSSIMPMAAFSSSYDERRGVGRVSFCYHHSRVTIKCPRCFRAIGVDDESGTQVSDECQVGDGVILGAWRCQGVSVYTPVA